MNLKCRLIAFGLALACSLQVRAAMQPEFFSLNVVPRHAVAATTTSKLLAQASSKSQPLRFAVLADLPVALDGGLWDRAPDDRARWRSRVSSTGAVAIGLEFSRFALPADAELWIYDAQGQLVQGPYTQRDQTIEGKLWTALVPGSEAVIELRVPEAQKSAVDLELGKLSHAYLDISKASVDAPAKSGSCNVDVICSDGNNWRDEIRSVARITVGNAYLCTGQLINNARQDHSPLFLTANHCEIGQEYPASSVVAYWNYQTTVCGRTPANGSLSQTTSGASLLAGDIGTDFTLLRLNSTPQASYNVYYAGWDAGSAAPQSGVAIHHPSGDEKRISTYTTAASAQTVCIDGTSTRCTRDVKAWQVNWARGTTEQGSSGGGLWNQNHRLVGVLSGGSASCADTGGNDYFARLNAAYQANSASSGQLKAWLDPDNIGIKRLTSLDSTQTAAAISSIEVAAENDQYTFVGKSSAQTLDVLANDSSTADGLHLASVSAPNHGGSVSISGDSIRYTPANGYVGTETFTYVAADNGGSATATVTITLTAPADSDEGSGGGGSPDVGLLAVLTALGLLRRQLTSRRACRA